MQLLSSFLFGCSASLDALLVGISYGLRKIPIRTLQNLLISLVSLLGTCLSACLGSRLLPLLPSRLADCTGSIILMLLGTYYIIKWTFSLLIKRSAPADGNAQTLPEPPADGKMPAPGKMSAACKMQVPGKMSAAGKPQTSGKIPIPGKMPPKSPRTGLSVWETFVLSLTLSVNNIGIGLSASMAGLQLLPAAAMTFGCSALFLLCGNRLGQSRFLRLIGSAADPISGLLLIGLGMLQLTI
ncbi:MAG: manganese efflux pump [Butyrivibrio sp.]|nr:manganese efflux pump [Acetatifactor muris]MCM1558755.1 manganese efflux pump [Butyrivibrio sp.]